MHLPDSLSLLGMHPQVIGKRKKMLRDMQPSLESELRHSLLGHTTEEAIHFLVSQLHTHNEAGALSNGESWYNEDHNFSFALHSMLKTKRDFLEVGPLRYAAVSNLEEPAFERLLLTTGKSAAYVSHTRATSAREKDLLVQAVKRFTLRHTFKTASSTDIRAVQDAVSHCDMNLLILTNGTLLRPWIVLELLVSISLGVPIVPLTLAATDSDQQGYDFRDHYSLLENFEEELERRNPGSMQTLRDNYVGAMPLKEALAKFSAHMQGLYATKLDMGGSQRVLAAGLSNLVSSGLSRTTRGAVPKPRYAAYLSSYEVEAGVHARILKTELMERVQRPVFFGKDDIEDISATHEIVGSSTDVLIILLTPGYFTRVFTVIEVLAALEAGVPILPVLCCPPASVGHVEQPLEEMAEFVRNIDDGRLESWVLPGIQKNYRGCQPLAEMLERMKREVPELLRPRVDALASARRSVQVLDYTAWKPVLDALLDDLAEVVAQRGGVASDRSQEEAPRAVTSDLGV